MRETETRTWEKDAAGQWWWQNTDGIGFMILNRFGSWHLYQDGQKIGEGDLRSMKQKAETV